MLCDGVSYKPVYSKSYMVISYILINILMMLGDS